jgi:hypothetical protein
MLAALSTACTWASTPASHRTTSPERRLPRAATLAQEEERLLLGAKGYGREEMLGERNDGGVGGCCGGDSIRVVGYCEPRERHNEHGRGEMQKNLVSRGTAMTALNLVLAGL